MKRILVAIMTGLVLSATIPSMAQHHRHTPAASMTVKKAQNVKKSADTAAIVAFSDTTSNDADVDSVNDTRTAGWDKPYDMDKVADIMEDAFLPIAQVFIIFFLAPVMIIALIIYFIIKSRKQKIQLAEMALKNGQSIPADILRNNIAKGNTPQNADLWSKGILKICLGMGIVMMGIFISMQLLKGIGFIVVFYGAGQAIIGWTTRKGIVPNNNKERTSYTEEKIDATKEDNGDEDLGKEL